MNIPCEIVVQRILPVVRAELAKELVQKHGLSQGEVAKELNLTQPAVSQYVSRTRGKGNFEITDKEFLKIISGFAKRIKEGKTTELDKAKLVCELCKYARETSLICKFHYPEGAPECTLCTRELNCY